MNRGRPPAHNGKAAPRQERGGADHGPKLEYPIPRQSADAWKKWKQTKGPHNPGLIFDRFAPDWSSRQRVDSEARREKKDDESAGTIKKYGLEQVKEAATKPDKELLAAHQARWQAIAEAVGAVPFQMKSDWRLITGLGRHGPLEVGFRFDRYGFPILPGSGLKGLARTVALVEIAERVGGLSLGQVEKALLDAAAALARLDRAERQRAATDAAWWQRALAAQGVAGADRAVGELAADFHAVFGTVGAAGGAVFLDAIPAGVPRLDLDIMNPHYPRYYQSNGTEPATGWQSPVPVYFLTVAAGVQFWFGIGWRGPRDAAAQARRQRAEGWLRRGLAELGAGAKTSAGYGYFEAQGAQPAVEAGQTARAAAPMGTQPTGPATPTAPAALSSAAAATPAPSASPVVTRQGVIVEIRPDKRYGRVRDSEDDNEYRFDIKAVQGNTPPNKARVEFDLQDGKVTRVRRV
jgi:CRISPR-associated protein Cmr6